MKKAYLNLKSLFKTALIALTLVIALPTPKVQASVYSLASKTMELVDPDGKNMVKFILTIGTAAGGVYVLDALDNKWARFERKYQIKRNSKFCLAAVAAWNFWSTVLPKSKR